MTLFHILFPYPIIAVGFLLFNPTCSFTLTYDCGAGFSLLSVLWDTFFRIIKATKDERVCLKCMNWNL